MPNVVREQSVLTGWIT